MQLDKGTEVKIREQTVNLKIKASSNSIGSSSTVLIQFLEY